MKKHSFVLAAILILSILSTPTWSAGNIKKTWAGETVLAETDGYGGAVSDLAADQAYDYTSDINLETNGYEGAVVTLEYDSAGTTDNIIVSVFGSYDGSSNYDDTPIWSQECDATSGADTQISFIVSDLSHFRIGVKTSGTTNTFDYQITYDAWRWYYE